MFYTLDRFESGLAVLLDDEKRTLSVEKSLLGENTEVGSVYFSENGQDFEFSAEETHKRKNKALNLHRSLFEKARKK